MTNLRINFTKLHTLGDDLLDKREDIQEKYYYAITEMVVRGSCSCYGHANRCLPSQGVQPKPDMVHGRCECTHNTKGRNCDKCEDFFNDLPWRPAIGKQTNACKKCNCNNHATSCRFSTALYEANGRISGGVCDDCKHNTIGSNCGQCAMFYYKDPERDIQDPEVCKPCDCDPEGSLNNGICDAETNEADGMMAGRCHCKSNVEGRRCDTCKNGYWNFTESGCQPCNCYLLGTVGNQGCNILNGECTCKRYVTGRECNQCLPQYYGLSEDLEGCRPCDCDPGGSEDNFCDVTSGQCKCKRHMTGIRCDKAKQFYFTANLDFLLYEAESGHTSPNSQVVIREPSRDGSKDNWTGTGFLKVFENSFLDVQVDDIKTTSLYNVEIRYDPTFAESLDNVIVTLIRPGPPSGDCVDSPLNETRSVILPPNNRNAIVTPSFCLEAGVNYLIHLEFRRYDYSKPVSPSASILIDSVVLTPSVDRIPWFNVSSSAGNLRRHEWDYNRCEDPIYHLNPLSAPPYCQNMYNSISAHIFNGAFSCSCNSTGAISNECQVYGGHCPCKPNIVGRRCDRCAPGTYEFGPGGCKACDCDGYGALDNYCNITTGQCKCRVNTYGRECNKCQTGFWNFPNCIRCECNGHAEECESKTGICERCKDNTEGPNCDVCREGHYGDPRLGVNIPCRSCPCPGLSNSNNTFAKTCSMDPYTKDAICQCQPGYSGQRCEVCANNYFGSPIEENGRCVPCDCDDKIDLNQPGNCDQRTGKCLQCLYNTTGDHCQVCQENYFRYTRDSTCQQCRCHPLGTDKSSAPCDPESGQCPCLPNVTGLTCSSCMANHWKIASGHGCEPCSCDSIGSRQTQCNEFTGQCECNLGFGGRQCDECVENHWGDPKVKCKQCDCDLQGSISYQCDSRTGACQCRPGVGGYRCDVCARGYLGYAPHCSPCGECFNNWDRILDETKNNTIDLIGRASEIKTGGARGAYTKEFDEMQNQLDECEQLLNNTDAINTDMIAGNLNKIRTLINATEQGKLKVLDEKITNTRNNITVTEIKIANLKNQTDKLNEKIEELENNGTQLQEDNVQGALTLIRNAKEKAFNAAHKAEYTQKTISETEREFKATENILTNNKDSYNNLLETNKKNFDTISSDVERLSKQIPSLNNLVCDGNGDPCDSLCGGAGCKACGGISCGNGAKQQAETALKLANSSESALRDKESLANDFIRNISQIDSNEAKTLVGDKFEQVVKIFNQLNTSKNQVDDLVEKIDKYVNKNITDPEDILNSANDILAKNLDTLSTEEIRKLAQEIKDKVESLTNTEAIIEATRDDLIKVNSLKGEADAARERATKLTSDIEDVRKDLDNSTTAQANAEKAINDALNNTDNVNNIITQIKEGTQSAHNKINETSHNMHQLEKKLDELQRNITANGFSATHLRNETATISKNAEKTYGDYNLLERKYDTAKEKLSNNIENVNLLRERADELFKKVVNLLANVTKTEEEIHNLEKESLQNPQMLENQLQNLIEKASTSTSLIETRINFYKSCNN